MLCTLCTTANAVMCCRNDACLPKFVLTGTRTWIENEAPPAGLNQALHPLPKVFKI